MDDRRLERAYRYCEWITYRHYENFPVASWLLPAPLRPHIAAVYAFARCADDFADEARYQGRSLDLLGQWRAALHASCNGGKPSHPIFLALSDTVRRRRLPVQLLDDLLTAFTMDVTKRRYANWEELMTYCRHSANPVGRLVLLIFGIRDEELHARSDEICSGLQLANHWQDLRIDLARGILYVPQELMRAFGVTEAELQERLSAAGPAAGSCRPLPCSDSPRPFPEQEQGVGSAELRAASGGTSPASPAAEQRFQSLMRELVARARAMFDSGERLLRHVPGGLRLELRLTLLGGRSILDRIEAAGHDVFTRRPVLSNLSKLGLLARALLP